MACRVVGRSAGRRRPIADADLAQLPDLGAAFNDEMLWRHHERRLADAGLALDGSGRVIDTEAIRADDPPRA